MLSEVEEGNASVEEWCDADEREKQEYAFKKFERTMFKKPFYFQLHTAKKWNPNNGTTIRGFVCRQETAFTICMDILKYVLTQATHWCAGFQVRVWWRYIRVRFADNVKWRVKLWVGQKEEKAIPLPSALYFI